LIKHKKGFLLSTKRVFCINFFELQEVSIISIILKFVLKNIYEKKFRTFLIVFSIMITSALMFASTAISGTMGKMYINRMKQYYGSSEIMIYSNNKSPSLPLISGAQKHRDHFSYIVGAFNGSAVYKPDINEAVSVSLVGINYEDLMLMNPAQIYADAGLQPFSGRKIIIGKDMSEKYKLFAGDYIDLTINDNLHKYLICAIAYPSGYFSDDGMNLYAVVPKDNLSALYNAKGKEGTIYLKMKNPTEKEELIKKLSDEYPKHTVTETISQEELAQQSSTLTTSFLLMTVIVFLMSVFIIYSSFKVLTAERLPVIGTFRSIGATRKMTDLVLLAESLMYSLIGGLTGCFVGIGILYIMSYMSRPVWIKGMETSIEFSPFHLVLTFLAAMVLGFISSIVPIIKVSKIPVKDIVLNSVEKKYKKKRIKLAMAIISICISVAVPPLLPSSQGMLLLVLCMILSLISVILLVPYITNIIARVFEKLFLLPLLNEGVLAAKNLRDNKSISTNISLLAIGISSILMINIVSSSVGVEVVNVFNDLNFDIWLNNYNSNRNFDQILKTVDGIGSITAAYEYYNVNVRNKNSEILIINGIDTNKYPDFWNIHIEGNIDEVYNELNMGRNILLSKALKDKFGVKKGDILELKMAEDIKEYKITGFFNTLMNNGNFALISEKYLRLDAKLNYYTDYYIKTIKDPEEVAKNIKNKFPRSGIYLRTMDEIEELNIQGNNQMFAILNGFSVMALVIGIFGVLNNFVISFIERKRWLAVYRSVGMNKRQIIRMLFIEALTGGLIGGCAGALSGLMLVTNVGYILKAMSLPVELHLTPTLFVYSILGGIFITLMASISPALKSSKLNIIDSIKFE